MEKVYIVTTSTSLPDLCYDEVDKTMTSHAYSTFGKAKDAFYEELRKYALDDNVMFSVDGTLINVEEYKNEIDCGSESEDEVKLIERLLSDIREVIKGNTVDISYVPERSEDGLVMLIHNEDSLEAIGYGDGPYNGVNPTIRINIFDMSSEKDYYFHVDDLFGQDVSAELYIDLKCVDLD